MVGILGANSLSGGGYEISNSLRFNETDSPELTKTFDAGNRKTWTISTWLKRGSLSEGIDILDVYTDESNWFAFKINHSNQKITLYQIDSGTDYGYSTTQVFRDPSAWYHIVFAVDTTQATAANRAKLYVNGSQISFGQTNGEYAENYDTWVNSTVVHKLGVVTDALGTGGTGSDKHTDGYMAEYYFLDGVAKVASDFGEFDDNGVWIPKAYEGTYGTNGFYLEFKQTGTGTDASGMGADTSGNDNHFAPTNLAATDVTTDTPTNNFCTMNPLHSEGMTFSEGNTDVLMSRSGAWNVAMGTMAIPNSGKWYMEVKIIAINASAHNVIGFLDAEYPFMGSNDTATGFTGGGTSWLSLVYFHAATDNAYVNSADGSAYQFENNTTFNGSVNDIYMMAFDRDNDKVWFGLNDAWAKANGTTGANPSTGADATITSVSSSVTYIPMGSGGSSTARQQWNFGNAPYAISSGNADANGYGNFEYAVPTGYYSLCTKNLAEFG